MADIQTGNARIIADPRAAARRRALELLMLGVASVAFLFALAVAFGLISG